jgi:hypothetical protein
MGGNCPLLHALDFGPYCSRNDSGGLALNLELLLASVLIKLVIASPAFPLGPTILSTQLLPSDVFGLWTSGQESTRFLEPLITHPFVPVPCP